MGMSCGVPVELMVESGVSGGSVFNLVSTPETDRSSLIILVEGSDSPTLEYSIHPSP